MDLSLEKKLEKVGLLFRIHRYEGAEKILASLLQEHPNFAHEHDLHALYATALYKQNKLEQTSEALRTALSKYPQSIELNLCLAANLSDLGSYEEAAEIFAKAKDFGFSSYRESIETSYRKKIADLNTFLEMPGHSRP